MHRCEAMVAQQKKGRKYYEVMFVPCGAENAELHHKLTRARGGTILDIAHETYHHLYLCREHHIVAHDEGSAFKNGLLIAGSVITGVDGKPRYFGPDEYLTEKYGEVLV
jgi:hypothetical protein